MPISAVLEYSEVLHLTPADSRSSANEGYNEAVQGPEAAQQLIAELDEKGSANLAEVVGLVSSITRYMIEIEPLGDRDWELVTGLFVLDPDTRRARVLVRKSDPRWYQLHVVLHELAHILLGHTECQALRLSFQSRTSPRSPQPKLGDGNINENEAEAYAHRLSEYILAPPFADDEKRFT